MNIDVISALSGVQEHVGSYTCGSPGRMYEIAGCFLALWVLSVSPAKQGMARRGWLHYMRMRLTAAFILVALLGLSLIGGYSLYLYQLNLYERADQEHEVRNKLATQKIEMILKNIYGDLFIAGHIAPIQGAIAARENGGRDPNGVAYSDWINRLESVYATIEAASERYFQIRYLDETGNEVVRVDWDGQKARPFAGSEFQNKAGRPYFQATMLLGPGEIYHSTIGLNQEWGKLVVPYQPAMKIAGPVFNPEGERKGIVLMSVRAERLVDQLSTPPVTEGAFIFVADNRGYYAHHGAAPEKEWGGPEDLDHGLSLWSDFPAEARQILSGKSGKVHAGQWAVYYDPIPVDTREGTFLVLGLATPMNRIQASVHHLILAFGCVLTFSLFLAVGAGFYLSKRITAPLEALRQGAREIASGKFNRRLQAQGTVEIADLAEDFNGMAAQLEKLYGNMEAEYAHLFESANDSIFIHGLDGRFIAMNQNAAHRLGYSREELLELSMEAVVAPEDAPLMWTNLRLLEEHGSLVFEITHRSKDGTSIHVEVSAKLLEHRGERVVQSFVRDISERKRAEAEIVRRNEELSAQNAIAATINQSLDLETLLDTALGKVIEVLKLDSGAIYLLEHDGATISMRAHRGLSDGFLRSVGRMDLKESYSGQAMIERKPVMLSSADYPATWRLTPVMNEEGLKTMICIPLLSRGTPLGSLTIGGRSERILTENEIELLVAIGRQIGVAVENSRLYEQILRQKQYAETVLHSIADGVYTVDRQSVVRSWSKGAEAITGYSAEDALGIPCSNFLRHVDESGRRLCETEGCPFTKVWATGRPVTPQQAFLQHRDGRMIPIAVTAAPIFDENGQSIGGVEVFRDVSKEIELMDRIQAANRAKSDFLANMSHELRTPLNAVIGFSQVLQEKYFGDLNEKQEEYLQDILDSGKHLLSLINDILDLSKVEAGKMELDLSYVNLRKLLEHSLIMIKEKASKHGVSLEIHVSPYLENMEIAVDVRKLKQIMFNLLSNAAKFTPDGGTIRVSAQISDEIPSHEEKQISPALAQPGGGCLKESVADTALQRVIRVCVEDTGIGIAQEDQKRIFDEFYQVRGGTLGKTPGTGLGLSLVKRFVEMQGGQVWPESEGLGKGSRFCFVLPTKTTDKA